MNKIFISFKTRPVKEITLEHGELTIGRASDNHIQINDPLVSAHHAKLVTIFDASHIEDLGSTNGTLVNKRKIQEHTLHDGDSITLGEYTISFSSDVPMEDSESQKTMMMDSDELEKMMEELDKPNAEPGPAPEVITHIHKPAATQNETPVNPSPAPANPSPAPVQSAPVPAPTPVDIKPEQKPVEAEKPAFVDRRVSKNRPEMPKVHEPSKLELLEDDDSMSPIWWILIIVAIIAILAVVASMFI